MALGLPVVSTNVGGLPYLISHDETGILVPPEDVQAMTEAVLYLHRHPDKALQMAERARTQVEKYDWSVVKEAWIKLLKA
jgi:glycosyltransferase involved in cell wall biosynthesis